MKKLLTYALLASLTFSPILAGQKQVSVANEQQESKVWYVIRNHVLPGVGVLCGFLALRWGWNSVRNTIRNAAASDINPRLHPQ